MAKANPKLAARVAASVQRMEQRNADYTNKLDLACQMLVKGAKDAQVGIKFGLDAITHLAGYQAQSDGIRKLASAYMTYTNSDTMRTKAPVVIESAIRYVQRKLKAMGFTLAKPPVAETKDAKRMRAARQAKGKTLKTGTKADQRKSGEVTTINKSNWDSMLIQADTKVQEMIEVLVPPSKLNEYNAARAAYNHSRAAFIAAIKPLVGAPADPAAKKVRAKRTAK